MNEAWNKIPDVWKTIIILLTVLGAGFTLGAATITIVNIPDRIEENSKRINENRSEYIDGIRSLSDEVSELRKEIIELSREFRLLNCQNRQQRNPTLDMNECMERPLPPGRLR